MVKKFAILAFVFFALSANSIFAQQKTVVSDAKARAMLLGRHKLSLQWISWNYFGSALVTDKNGLLSIKGKQTGRKDDDYLTIDGIITSVDAKEFKFDGKIVVKVSYLNNGEPCERTGEMTFKITGRRKYWRLQEMTNPCDEAVDYVDVFFR